jgi:hypothetical protein
MAHGQSIIEWNTKGDEDSIILKHRNHGNHLTKNDANHAASQEIARVFQIERSEGAVAQRYNKLMAAAKERTTLQAQGLSVVHNPAHQAPSTSPARRAAATRKGNKNNQRGVTTTRQIQRHLPNVITESIGPSQVMALDVAMIAVRRLSPADRLSLIDRMINNQI